MTRPIESSWGTPSRLMTALREITQSRFGCLRVLNAAMGELQSTIGMEYLLAMPSSFAIEVTNLCDGGCLLCPVGQSRRSRSPGRLSWDRFRQIVNQIHGFARFIGLYNWGEPFLHPRIYDMISHVTARKIFTKISSNLHSFAADDAERLVRTNLDDLAISLHGLSEETYRSYQPRHSFTAVVEKVRAIADAKCRLASSTPTIHLGFVVTRFNEHEVPDLPDFAASLGVGYLLEETSVNLRLLPYDRKMKRRHISEQALSKERLEIMKHWLPQQSGFINPWYLDVSKAKGAVPTVPEKLFACLAPWREITVCWDGDVNLCCGSFEQRHSVGNIFEQSLREIWNNSFYRAARRNIRGRSRESDTFVLCRTCPGALL